MSKTVKYIIISVVSLIFAITILFFVYYGVSYNAKDNVVADLVNTGNDFMASENYTDAITKYVAALEYEPENDDLKRAIAHAYVCLAGTLGDTQPAIDAYQSALVFNQRNTNAYWGMAGIYENLADEDNLLLTLQTGYANTDDVDMKIKADNIEIERARIQAEQEALAREEAERLALEESHNDLLSALIPLFEAENRDLEAIKEVLRSEQYVTMVDEVIGKDNSFYYGERDSVGQRLGKGIAVYADGYFYYGDFIADQRSGEGIYIRAVYSESSSIGSYMYEGGWLDDMPNGSGVATSSYYKDKISSAEFLKQEISGSYKNGLESGKMTLNGTTKGGGTVKYVYSVKDGVADKSSDESSGVKGQYIIATSSDGKSNLTSDGSQRGVEGFIE